MCVYGCLESAACLARRCLYVPQKPFVEFLSKVIQGGIGPAEDLNSVGPKVFPLPQQFCCAHARGSGVTEGLDVPLLFVLPGLGDSNEL